ncbi:MAG: hypothetical protein IPG08_10665 [Sphingobacteriaceae bacterium]|nr:hypothetical protein [Sphingobacteriaceae bacterium]
MRKILIVLALISNVNGALCQKEINLGIDEVSIGVTPYLFSISTTENNKVLVKYLCFPACLVLSNDESTMNGAVITANKLGMIKGGIELSDAAMVLVTHLVDPAASTFSLVQKDIIAIRNVDQSKAYFISLDRVDNKCKHIYERKEVPYNKGNLATIKI